MEQRQPASRDNLEARDNDLREALQVAPADDVAVHPDSHRMIAAPTRNDIAPVACESEDECPLCGTAPGPPTLLTSMTRYYACGNCATGWSVARKWLRGSHRRTA